MIFINLSYNFLLYHYHTGGNFKMNIYSKVTSLIKSKKNTLITLSSTLFLLSAPTTILFAAEVYNKDNTNMSIYGKFTFSMSSTNKNYGEYTYQSHSSRFGALGSSELSEKIKSVFRLEFGINPFTEPTTVGAGIKNRLGYAGIEYNNQSKIYFGRQYTTFYDIAEFTDYFNINGGEANTNFDDGEDGGVLGTGRANAIVYRYETDKIQLGFQGLANETFSTNTDFENAKRNYGLGLSARYLITPKFKIGVAYNYVDLEDINHKNNPNQEENPIYKNKSQAIIGARYEDSRFVFALTASYSENAYSSNDTIGTESFIAFKYKKESNDLIYIGHVQTTETSDHYDGSTNLGHAMQRLYLALGIQKEIFTPNLLVFSEFKYDMRSTKQKENAINTSFEEFQGTNNKLSFGLTYRF